MTVNMWKKVVKFFGVGLIAIACKSVTAQDNNTNAHRGTLLKTIIIDPGHGLPDMGNVGKDGSYESDISLAIGFKVVQKLRDSMPGVKVLMTRTDANLPNNMTNKDAANRWRANFANENHGDLFVSIHVNDDGRNGKEWHSEVVGYETKVYYTGKGKRRKKHTRKEPIIRRYSVPTGVVGTESYIWSVSKNDSKTSFVKDNDFGEFSDADSTSDSTAKSSESPEAQIAASIRMRKYFERSLMLGTLIQNNFVAQGRVDRGVKQRPKGIWVLQATAMPSVLVETGFSCNEGEEEYLTSPEGQDQVASAIFRGIVQYQALLQQRGAAISSANSNGDTSSGRTSN
ncbi:MULTISPECIES: N-acetylmuramoyl-L-alanine amidase family protein [Chitinophagaceae]